MSNVSGDGKDGRVVENEMSLGEFLRQEREQRGITIEQVASATKIGVRTLHLLEENHFQELPAKPFIRGFVTSYCRFVGVDPKEVLARFEDYIVKRSMERPNRESGHSGYAFDKKDGEQQGRTILMLAIIGFATVGGIAMFILKPSLHHHRRSHIEKLRETHSETMALVEDPTAHLNPRPTITPNRSIATPLPFANAHTSTLQVPLVQPSPLLVSANAAVENPAPSPIPSVIPSPTLSPLPVAAEKAPVVAPPTEVKAKLESETQPPESQPAPIASPQVAGSNPNDPLDSGLGLKGPELHHKIVSKVVEDIWVRYQVDDKPLRKFIVRKGRTLVLRGKEKIWLQVSNPKSFLMSYNNQGSRQMSEFKNHITMNGVATVFYPHELAEKIGKDLSKQVPLPQTPDPSPDQESQQSPVKP